MERMVVSLEFAFDSLPEHWTRLLDAFAAWDRSLQPQTLHRLTDLDPPEEEPWTESRAGEASNRLASGPAFTWEVFGREECGLTLRRISKVVEIRARVQRPENPPLRFRDLLDQVSLICSPLLAMAWAMGTEDDELLLEGLHRLVHVPPLLFLASTILDRVGRDALTGIAPVVDVAGGLLFVLADPWNRADPDGKRRRRAVARILGMTGGSAVALI